MKITTLLICFTLTTTPLFSQHCRNRCDGAVFAVDALWWTLCQDNLDFVIEYDPFKPDYILGPGKRHFLDWDYCPGVRGCLGYKWCGWVVFGEYLWYRNWTAHSISTKNQDSDLLPTLLHPLTAEILVDKARAESEILYQTANLLFGKDLSFSFSSCFLHPFVGVQAIEIKQQFNVFYEEENFSQVRVDWHANLTAIGLRAGLNMYYYWFCGFAITGGFSGSVLASWTRDRERQLTNNFEDNFSDRHEIDLKEKNWECVPGYQMSAAISWDANVRNCYAIQFRLGYEFTHWFNLPFLRRYHSENFGVSSNSRGNIGFHGATLSAALHF